MCLLIKIIKVISHHVLDSSLSHSAGAVSNREGLICGVLAQGQNLLLDTEDLDLFRKCNKIGCLLDFKIHKT